MVVALLVAVAMGGGDVMGELARLKVPPGQKRVYTADKRSIARDINVRRIKVDGKGILKDGKSYVEPQGGGFNIYRRGVVIKVRDRPGQRARVVVTNTTNKPKKVGMRYDMIGGGKPYKRPSREEKAVRRAVK